MTDRDALLAAVLAAPDDDLPRLVYADWLEETGQPANAARAAFVRLQVEAERHPAGSTERADLLRRADEVFALYGAGWQAELPEWVTWRDTEVGYRRGFVEVVAATPRRLFRDGHELFAAAPITDVRLRAQNHYSGRRPDRLLWDPPFFDRVRSLTLGPGLWVPADEDPEHRSPTAYLLINSKHLTGLRRLVAVDIGVTDEWVVRFATGFAGSAFAGTLTELDLSRNAITDAGAHTLATARGPDRLTRLVLTGNRIGPAGVSLLRRRFGERVIFG